MTKNQNRLSQLLLVVLLFYLGGCTMLGPDFEPLKAPIPDSWSEQNYELFKKPSKDETAAWWRQFNDPVLNNLVQLAYEQNLSLRSAALRIMEARANMGSVKGQIYPQVQEKSGDLYSVGTTGPSDNRYYNTASVGFDVAWEMDFWGKYRRSIESSEANLLAFVADYDDVLVSLTAEVAKTYVNICTLYERIRLAEKNVRIQEDGLKLVNAQFDAGTVTELDVLQGKTLLSTTQATIPKIQSTLAVYKHSLALLLGIVPSDVENLLGIMDSIPAIDFTIEVVIPAELMRRRPDIRRSEMEAAAQSAQIGIARTDLFPSFTLFGSVGWSANDIGNNSLGDIFDSNSFSYTFGPSFTWNLFNYGRLENQVRVQDARFQQLITSYQNTVLKAAKEVEDSMTGIVYARREAEYVHQAIASSQKSLELAMLQYEEGLVDYQRVLDSTRSVTQKQDQYAQLEGEIVTNVIALYKALGGGWQIRTDKDYLPNEVRKQMEERTNWGDLLQIPETDDK